MKNIRFLVLFVTISTLVLSACGAAAATPAVQSGKVAAMPVAFIGIVDSIAGDQWVISGTTMTVKPEVVRDGPFSVGDQVKVEGIVNTDGSFSVSRVEVPAPQDISTLSPFGNDNFNDANANDSGFNANTNDSNSNDFNSNDDNSNAANSNNANVNDNNGSGSNSNDDNSNGGSNNSNDDNSNDSGGSGRGGSGGGGDDNSGSGKGRGGGDDSGGDDHGGGGKGSDD